AALGVITDPNGTYSLTLTSDQDATIDLSVAMPRTGGSVAHAVANALTLHAHRPARVVFDPARADRLTVDQDVDDDQTFETSQALSTESLTPQGPTLVSATVVGPELVSGAS